MKHIKIILLLTFCMSSIMSTAQKSKRSKGGDVITLTALKLGPDHKVDTKYDWSDYYKVSRGILKPVKGAQMVYSYKYNRIYVTKFKGQITTDDIADGVSSQDGKIDGINASFHCGGCGTVTECNPGIISVSKNSALVGCTAGCDMCIGWTEFNNGVKPSEVQTANGSWNPLDELR